MTDVGKDIRDAYNKIALKYEECLWDDMPYNDYINKFLSLLNGKNILDIGCAIGSFTKYVADKGYKVEGIDISPNMIDIAKSKVKNETAEKVVKIKTDNLRENQFISFFDDFSKKL